MLKTTLTANPATSTAIRDKEWHDKGIQIKNSNKKELAHNSHKS